MVSGHYPEDYFGETIRYSSRPGLPRPGALPAVRSDEFACEEIIKLGKNQPFANLHLWPLAEAHFFNKIATCEDGMPMVAFKCFSGTDRRHTADFVQTASACALLGGWLERQSWAAIAERKKSAVDRYVNGHTTPVDDSAEEILPHAEPSAAQTFRDIVDPSDQPFSNLRLAGIAAAQLFGDLGGWMSNPFVAARLVLPSVHEATDLAMTAEEAARFGSWLLANAEKAIKEARTKAGKQAERDKLRSTKVGA